MTPEQSKEGVCATLCSIKHFGLPVLLFSLGLGCGPIKLAEQETPALLAPKTLADTPKATASITPPTSTSRNSLGSGTARIGVKLNELSTTFTSAHSTYSRGFCESSILVRDLYREIAKTDLVGCYLGVLEKHGSWSSANQDSTSQSSLYDGHDHYLTLSHFANANGTVINGKVKVNLTQDSNGNLTDYKIYACLNGGSNQTEYLAGTFSTSGASLVAAESNSLGNTRATISGSLASSSGSWASKTVIGHQNWSQNVDLLSINTHVAYQSKATLKQSKSTLTINGFVRVTQSPSPLPLTSPSASDLNAVTGVIFMGTGAVMQGLNMNQLSTFALGEGSSNYYDSATMLSSAMPVTHHGTQSWNGDTIKPLSSASSGTFYPSLVANLPPTSFESVKSTFQANETWDCLVPASESAFALDYTTLSTSDSTLQDALAACSSTYYISDTGYVDCSTTQ